MLFVGRLHLWNERDVRLVPEFVGQIPHLRVDTVFVLRSIATVLPSVAVAVLVMTMRRYRIIELIEQIVRHFLEDSVVYSGFIRTVFLGQQLLRGSHHTFRNIFHVLLLHDFILLF